MAVVTVTLVSPALTTSLLATAGAVSLVIAGLFEEPTAISVAGTVSFVPVSLVWGKRQLLQDKPAQ